MIEEWKQAVVIPLIKWAAQRTLITTDPFPILPTAGELWERQIHRMPPL